MAQTAAMRDPSSAAIPMAAEAHETSAVVLGMRRPRGTRRQREAAVAARARLLRTTVPVR